MAAAGIRAQAACRAALIAQESALHLAQAAINEGFGDGMSKTRRARRTDATPTPRARQGTIRAIRASHRAEIRTRIEVQMRKSC
jgi:hypothetical protein